MTAPLLRVEALDVRFGDRVAIAGASLEVGPGELIAVVGPNGAGKTTLLRAILGLVPPSAGTVSCPTRPGYVPQRDEEELGYPLTALDVVLIGAYRRRPFWRPLGRELRAEGLALLDRVGLADRAGSPIGELSGGQRQRVLLARALIGGSPLLLLDEPLTGVDVTSQDVVVEVLAELRAAGASALVATHDLELARVISTRMLFVNGRIVADGPPAATYTAATLKATFAGSLLVLEERDHAVELVDPGSHGAEPPR